MIDYQETIFEQRDSVRLLNVSDIPDIRNREDPYDQEEILMFAQRVYEADSALKMFDEIDSQLFCATLFYKQGDLMCLFGDKSFTFLQNFHAKLHEKYLKGFQEIEIFIQLNGVILFNQQGLLPVAFFSTQNCAYPPMMDSRFFHILTPDSYRRILRERSTNWGE